MPSIKLSSIKKKIKKTDFDIDYKSCIIHLLDANQPPLVINLKNDSLGFALIDEVFVNIGEIAEKDYFGLRYKNKLEERFWLKLEKPVIKQCQRAKTNKLYFSIKYYPENPMVDFAQDLTRYQLYLQLRKDLYSECLIVNEELLPKLISLVIQAETGNCSTSTKESILNSINLLKIIKNVSVNTLNKVSAIIQTPIEMESQEAENQFILLVSQLESYGVEPNCVYDTNGNKIFLAMNHQGICTFVGSKRTHIYYWENILKMVFISKMFMIEININNCKEKIEFKFGSEKAASTFWTWAWDRQNFVTLSNSSEAKKVKSNYNPFRRKIKHKFSGRSKREVTESCQTLSTLSQPSVIRTRNPVLLSRSNSAKAVFRDSMVLENEDSKQLGNYATMPRRSITNNHVSMVSIDFQTSMDVGNFSQNSSIEEDLIVISNDLKCESFNEPVLSDIDENINIADIEMSEFSTQELNFTKNDDSDLDTEIKLKENENQIRERRTELLHSNSKDSLINCLETNEIIPNCTGLENDFTYQSNDGMFFVKFVAIITFILLVVMISSLVVYYYYRSASIADMKKQKYSSEWNKNIDLEAIKRFVLRHDAP